MNDGDARANIPLDQYAFYIQDDWRVTSKLTINAGLRYDVVDGFQIDQSGNPNFVKMQDAGRAGLLAGIKGLENFGKDPKEDTNNWQPRIGFAYDVRGDGKDVVRGGWGIYQDVGYTNSNVLFPASDAAGRFGTVFDVDLPAGIRNPDGSFYRVGQPLSNIQSQNVSSGAPLFGQFLDPRFEMPYSRQLSIGWSHELMESSVVTVDYVNNDGRDLNTRPRLNVYIPGTTTRRLAFLGLTPAAIGTRAASSFGSSEYRAMIVGFKRRMHKGIDFTATYTLQEATSNIGSAVDELNANNLQDAYLLYDDPRVDGPTSRTDARHSGTLSGIVPVEVGHPARAAVHLPHGAAGVDHRRPRPELEQREQRSPGDGLCLRRHERRRHGAREGDRRVQDLQLRPRRGAHAVQPARQQDLPRSRPCGLKRLPRSSTCSTR